MKALIVADLHYNLRQFDWLLRVTGVGGGGLSPLLWLFGLAAVAANLLGGAAADRFGPVPTIAGLTLGSAAVLLALPALDAQPLTAAVFVILRASPATPS